MALRRRGRSATMPSHARQLGETRRKRRDRTQRDRRGRQRRIRERHGGGAPRRHLRRRRPLGRVRKPRDAYAWRHGNEDLTDARSGNGFARCCRRRSHRPAAPPTTTEPSSTASSGCCARAAPGAAAPRATVPGRRSQPLLPLAEGGVWDRSWPNCNGGPTPKAGWTGRCTSSTAPSSGRTSTPPVPKIGS